MNMKKYFLKDEPITNENDDLLNIKDITKNAKLIIDNTTTPYAIAITGKNGLGKTSMVNVLVKEYEENKEKYNVEKINVWKNEKSLNECIERYDKFNSISNKEEQPSIEVNNSTNYKFTNGVNIGADNAVNNNNNKFKVAKKITKALLVFLLCFIITSAIFIFMEYMQNKGIYNKNDIFFVENTYLSYKENFGTISIFAIGFTAIIYMINTVFAVKKKSSTTLEYSTIKADVPQENLENISNELQSGTQQFNVMPNNVEDNELPQIVENVSKDNQKINLVVIEDIDKLPITKMLNTFDKLKKAADCSDCIFIVTFDEKIVNKAINMENKAEQNVNYRNLEFEKIIDKIFQYKINIPRLSQGDIKEYMVRQAEKDTQEFTEEYCNKEEFEKIIKNVLIYNGVNTPRKAKKLVNNFINNKISIDNRIKSGKIEESVAQDKNFNFQLAKISVLQADFKEFYNTLFKDLSYLSQFTELCCMDIEELRNVYDDIDENLKIFFTNKYKKLRNFLRQTKMYKVDNISIIMYLSKVKTEKIYKGKSVLGYIMADEDISELRIQEVYELVNLIDNKEDLTEFATNNFSKLLQRYEEKADNKIFFDNIRAIVQKMENCIKEDEYEKFLEIAAKNYKYYPDEALDMFNNLENDIPANTTNILLQSLENNLTRENYEKTFEFIKKNSDGFYEEGGNISAYVDFLVNYIKLSQKPDEIIQELDENFTRIGKVYELVNNIKNIENLDYNKAYAFIAKCLDNSNLDRMVSIMNTILSDEDSVESCIQIEEKMTNYNLKDVVEYNVDDIVDAENANEIEENNKPAEKKAPILLKNLLEISAKKQQELDPKDVMKIVEEALKNTQDFSYILSIYTVLKEFDNMYFYEIRRDFNEIIYQSFHTAKKNAVKDAALECTKYFKNTRLFLTKVNEKEKKYYQEN